MERARQLVGEVLIGCFLVVLLTGGYLAFHYSPSGAEVVYEGSYEPLRGVPMSSAYASTLEVGFDVPGGLLAREVHHTSWVVLVVGAVVWALLGRLRYAVAVLALGGLAVLGGHGAVGDLVTGTVLGRVPVPVWYGLHLAAAVAILVVLVVSSRREAARRPRTVGFVALAVAVTVVIFFPWSWVRHLS